MSGLLRGLVGLAQTAGRVWWLQNTPAGRELAEGSEQRELALNAGRQLGLSKGDTEETVAVWLRFYREADGPINWHEIRQALVHRALGDAPWGPPDW